MRVAPGLVALGTLEGGQRGLTSSLKRGRKLSGSPAIRVQLCRPPRQEPSLGRACVLGSAPSCTTRPGLGPTLLIPKVSAGLLLDLQASHSSKN